VMEWGFCESGPGKNIALVVAMLPQPRTSIGGVALD